MRIHQWLKILAQGKRSDLFLATGAPPCAKFAGEVKTIEPDVLAPGEVATIADEIMDDTQREEFARELEMNLGLFMPGIGRFRVNIFRQRNEVSIVSRFIVSEIPQWHELGLPEILTELIMQKRGLVLFVGATGSGKSTSLAAMVDYRNRQASGHIVTIEDPLEFVHEHKKSIITQREVGVDTRNWHNALKNTLRQAPDVVLIGEIRDRETMEHALAFAETGHLCISTLHANNANQALDRIINFFPEEKRQQLLMDLSFNMQAFVSQRLISNSQGGRSAAVEVMLGSPIVKELILRGDIHGLKEIMEKSKDRGMKTFDMALLDLCQSGVISERDALCNADSENNLRLKLKLAADPAPGRDVPSFKLED
jgi:twitching motility protein PilU